MATIIEAVEIPRAKQLLEQEHDDPMAWINSFHFTQGEIQVRFRL